MNESTEHDPARHDPTLHDAYDRLGAGVRPPADGPERVLRRIAVRRRRRRAAAGVAALALVGGVGAAAVTTGGDPDRVVDAASQPEPPALTTTLADGTTHTFEGVELTCFDGLLTAYNEQVVTRDADEEWSEPVLSEPFLYLEVRTDAVDLGKPYQLPVDGPGGSGTYPVLLFFAIDDDGAGRPNELSSAEGEASGTVRVDEATCGPEPTLALTADVVLGSELQGRPSMPLRGGLDLR
ncbi:hypothetical protein GGQ22_00115 [Nocardioides sp. zg-579]|uniref:Uncharacterized protein n=1 Tax=Nocardioides marmotae TaxID=2663857 RepID=A0A6I3J3V3_9ACTN|nr:hypothetical protein [Nocardioides marmotae]MCR6029844.1 hypothetical protein [Gordonia jinghuaiqii]MTB93474.1 hypothetical protein [Nocardioides marmotae]QKD99856.1 hypothetical protein HPC71_01185 [Nocardioides marmotae]